MATIHFDVEDYLDEVFTADLLDELKSREADLSAFMPKPIHLIPPDLEGRKLKHFICDFLGLGHYSSADEVVNALRQRM